MRIIMCFFFLIKTCFVPHSDQKKKKALTSLLMPSLTRTDPISTAPDSIRAKERYTNFLLLEVHYPPGRI